MYSHKQMACLMKWTAYLLILLTFWGQIDDVVLASASVSSLVTSDDADECLPSTGNEAQAQFRVLRRAQTDSFKPETADFQLGPTDATSDCNLTVPCTPSLLYLFMSFLI